MAGTAVDNSASVLFERVAAGDDNVLAVATLNVEKTLNALTLDMVELLSEQLQQWRDDPAVVAVWLQGAGEKAFCAGGDVQKLYQSAIETPGGPCTYAEQFFEREYRLDYLLHCFPKPVICWGHGIVMGGGLGLMAGCRHRIVTGKTRMAMPEITIALYPDVGGSWFLNRAPGRSGLYLALTAASLNAADCLFVGYADYCVAVTQKQELLKALQQLPWTGHTETDNACIRQLLEAMAASSAAQVPRGNVEAHFEQIQQLTAHDSLPAIVDAILAHTASDEWLRAGQAALAHGSPLSACNIEQAQRLTRNMSLAQVFQFELMLSTNVVRHPEFAEGVRALLIDKDKQPRWQYSSVATVPANVLQQMVTPPWPVNPLADLSCSH